MRSILVSRLAAALAAAVGLASLCASADYYQVDLSGSILAQHEHWTWQGGAWQLDSVDPVAGWPAEPTSGTVSILMDIAGTDHGSYTHWAGTNQSVRFRAPGVDHVIDVAADVLDGHTSQINAVSFNLYPGGWFEPLIDVVVDKYFLYAQGQTVTGQLMEVPHMWCRRGEGGTHFALFLNSYILWEDIGRGIPQSWDRDAFQLPWCECTYFGPERGDAPIAEPASVMLLGTGLLGLARRMGRLR